MIIEKSTEKRLLEIQQKKEAELKRKFRFPINKKRLMGMSEEEIENFKKELFEYNKTRNFDKEKHLEDEKRFKLFGNVIIPMFDKVFCPKYYNKEVLDRPKENPDVGRLFVSNHIDSLDHFAVISAIGVDKPLHPLASTTLLNLQRGKLYKSIGCVFLDLKDLKSMLKGLEEGMKLLANGHDVLVFPEGTRNKTDNFMLEFKEGAALMAQSTGATVYPIGITDDYRPIKNNLNIRFAEPLTVDVLDDVTEKTDEIRNRIATQLYDSMYDYSRENHDVSREKLIKRYEKKKMKIEKQRTKINK